MSPGIHITEEEMVLTDSVVISKEEYGSLLAERQKNLDLIRLIEDRDEENEFLRKCRQEQVEELKKQLVSTLQAVTKLEAEKLEQEKSSNPPSNVLKPRRKLQFFLNIKLQK